jgi:hypothetical protein
VTFQSFRQFYTQQANPLSVIGLDHPVRQAKVHHPLGISAANRSHIDALAEIYWQNKGRRRSKGGADANLRMKDEGSEAMLKPKYQNVKKLASSKEKNKEIEIRFMAGTTSCFGIETPAGPQMV